MHINNVLKRFSEVQPLAQKMTELSKLASELHSKQDPYDFGMRAVKPQTIRPRCLREHPPHPSDARRLAPLRQELFLNLLIPKTEVVERLKRIQTWTDYEGLRCFRRQ